MGRFYRLQDYNFLRSFFQEMKLPYFDRSWSFLVLGVVWTSTTLHYRTRFGTSYSLFLPWSLVPPCWPLLIRNRLLHLLLSRSSPELLPLSLCRFRDLFFHLVQCSSLLHLLLSWSFLGLLHLIHDCFRDFYWWWWWWWLFPRLGGFWENVRQFISRLRLLF